MNNRLALLIAVVLGVVCAVALHGWEQTQADEMKKQYVTRPILVAEHGIKAGTVLNRKAIEKYLTEKQIPEKFIVSGMMTINDLSRYQNYVVSRRINDNAPLLSQFLEPNLTQNATTDSLVISGMRAVTIPVDQVGAVAGLLRPGDRVDVVGNFDIATSGAGGRPGEIRRVTIPLLEAARIIALDNQTRSVDIASSRLYRTVTLEVSPYNALRLLNALEQGSIQFLLRNRVEADKRFESERLIGVDLKKFELQELAPYTQFAPPATPIGPESTPSREY